MTAADEIQAAARTLRSLLADRQLTPGPWLSMDRGDRVLWNGDGAEDLPPQYVIDEPMSNGANADYLAVMHPDVGHALADWLEFHAAMDERLLSLVEGAPGMDEATWGGKPHPALAVARAINGQP